MGSMVPTVETAFSSSSSSTNWVRGCRALLISGRVSISGE